MDLTLTRRGGYVLQAALCLARADGRYRKVREIVAQTGVPRTFAPQILADLVRSGVARSRAGRDGGYVLTRSADSITLLEVLEAGEGPLGSDHCALWGGPCQWERVCPVHATWSVATERLRQVLAATSLADVAARDDALAAGTYQVPDDSHRARTVAVDVSRRVVVDRPAAEVRAGLLRIQSEFGDLVAAAVADDGDRGYVLATLEAPKDDAAVARLSWRSLGERVREVEATARVDGDGESRCALVVEGTGWVAPGDEHSPPDAVAAVLAVLVPRLEAVSVVRRRRR